MTSNALSDSGAAALISSSLHSSGAEVELAAVSGGCAVKSGDETLASGLEGSSHDPRLGVEGTGAGDADTSENSGELSLPGASVADKGSAVGDPKDGGDSDAFKAKLGAIESGEVKHAGAEVLDAKRNGGSDDDDEDMAVDTAAGDTEGIGGGVVEDTKDAFEAKSGTIESVEVKHAGAEVLDTNWNDSGVDDAEDMTEDTAAGDTEHVGGGVIRDTKDGGGGDMFEAKSGTIESGELKDAGAKVLDTEGSGGRDDNAEDMTVDTAASDTEAEGDAEMHLVRGEDTKGKGRGDDVAEGMIADTAVGDTEGEGDAEVLLARGEDTKGKGRDDDVAEGVIADTAIGDTEGEGDAEMQSASDDTTVRNDSGTVGDYVSSGTDGSGAGNEMEVEESEPAKEAKEPTKQAAENVPHARYYIPYPDSKTLFDTSNMVWGKVKSHPWWPGEVFDPAHASELALKRQKEGKMLIAYFEDRTFAWIDKTQLKPFFNNFTEMEKQSKLESFKDAVNAALEEVARRVEVGLTCSCFADEAYAAMKSKTVDNTGLQEGTCCAAVDWTLIANSFEPDRFLFYVKSLAEYAIGGADRLELVTLKAQLKSFYHSKGCPVLPAFLDCGDLKENDDALTASAKISTSNSGKGKLRGKGRSSTKGKQTSDDGGSARVKKSSGASTEFSDVTLPASSSGKEKSVGKGSSSVKGKQTLENSRSVRVKKSGAAVIDPSNVTLPASSSGKGKLRGKERSSTKGKQTSDDGGSAGGSARVKKSGGASTDFSDVTPPASSSGKEKSVGKGSSSVKGKRTLENGRSVRLKKSGAAVIDPSTVTLPASSSGKGRSLDKRSSSIKEKQTLENGRSVRVKKSSSSISDPVNLKSPVARSGKGKSRGTGSKLSKPVEEEAPHLSMDSGRVPSGGSILISSGKKRKHAAHDGTPEARDMKKKRSGSLGVQEAVTPSPRSARIGERMSRIASQMTGSPPMIKSDVKTKISGLTSRKWGRKLDADDAFNTLAETSSINRGFREACLPSEVVAQLHVAASDPAKEHDFLPTLVSFLTDFRDWIRSTDEKHLVSVGSKRGSKKLTPAKSATAEEDACEVEDSYWAGLIVRDRPEEDSDISDVIFQDSPERRESKSQRKNKKMKLTGEEPTSCVAIVGDAKQPLQSHSTVSTLREVSEERRVNDTGEEIAKDYSPTSLILSFTESDALPSEADLINIFSRSGTLEEAETEIQEEEKRARVVFRTRADAEAACRSEGTSSLFGSSVVSYRLKDHISSSIDCKQLANGVSPDEAAGVVGETHKLEPWAIDHSTS